MIRSFSLNLSLIDLIVTGSAAVTRMAITCSILFRAVTIVW